MGYSAKGCQESDMPEAAEDAAHMHVKECLVGVSLLKSNLTISDFFFGLHRAACGILVSQPGIEPTPLQWKLGVLTTGLPGKSL